MRVRRERERARNVVFDSAMVVVVIVVVLCCLSLCTSCEQIDTKDDRHWAKQIGCSILSAAAHIPQYTTEIKGGGAKIRLWLLVFCFIHSFISLVVCGPKLTLTEMNAYLLVKLVPASCFFFPPLPPLPFFVPTLLQVIRCIVLSYRFSTRSYYSNPCMCSACLGSPKDSGLLCFSLLLCSLPSLRQ